MLRTCITFSETILLLAIVVPNGLMANEFDPFKNPDAFMASHLAENQDKINQLVVACEDTSKTAAERIEALIALHRVLPDVALPTMVELIKDEKVEVASKAAEMLSDASMMMNHKMPISNQVDHDENPFVKYGMARHKLIFDSLLKSLEDSRREVRGYAASSLSANSDEEAVAKIVEAARSGAYSQEEVVSYLSLASPEVAGEHLTQYLDSKDIKILTPVSRYLAESRYQGEVRDKVLFNDDAPMESRQACAELLPTGDLLPLFVSPETPEDLYSSALGEYIKRRRNKLTKPLADQLLKGIQRFGPDSSDKTKERLHRTR